MASARKRVAGFWDQHVGAWLAGADPMADPLPRWFASFQGQGAGLVTRDGFPEPYAGDLLGRVGLPRLVVLGLNPAFTIPSSRRATESSRRRSGGSAATVHGWPRARTFGHRGRRR